MIGGDWLAERARRTPHRVALCEGGAQLDYAALDARAQLLAHGLGAAGVGPGDRLAVWLAGGGDTVALIHAARRRGALLVPLNTRLQREELAFQLADAQARLLVHDASAEVALAAAAGVGVPTRALAGLADRSGAPHPRTAAPARPPDDGRAPSTLVYTSGTTGRPKGALLTPHNFLASATASAFHLGALPGDRWLACLPLFHVGGLAIVWRSVLYGASITVHARFDVERVNHALDREGVSAVSLTATMLARVLDARGDRPPAPTLRFVLLGGGPVPAPLLERAAAAGLPVAPTYGLTEATSQVATRPPDACVQAGLAPLPGTELRIAGEADRWRGADEVGEICLRGPTVMAGYWRRTEATAETLRGGWLRTGDVGRLDAEGNLHVLDRRSDLIVSGGENVYPAEVEAVLLAHPAIAEVGVAGVADPVFGSRPAAWWVARRDRSADDEALRRFCRERLAGYKVPVAFHRVASLPRTAAGKLRRHALAAGGAPGPEPS